MLLLLQNDVTARVEMEVRMTALNETQINLLDQVWKSVDLHAPTSGEIMGHIKGACTGTNGVVADPLLSWATGFTPFTIHR